MYRFSDVLLSLVRFVESHVDGLLCSVLLLAEDGQHVKHGAAPSLPEAYVRAIDGAAIGPCAGSCGTAMYIKEPVIVTDILTDPLWEDYRDLATPHGLRACWSTPILSHEGKVLGSFAMYYREPRSPTAAETRLIGMATHIASIAIECSQVHEKLLRSEERYRTFFEEAVVGIFQSDESGRYLNVNSAMARMLGYESPHELLTSVTDVAKQVYVHPTDRAAFRSLIDRQGVAENFEFEVYRKDGSKIWISANARAVRSNGILTGYEGTSVDITRRKLLEQQLRQSHKIEAVGRLAGGLAHDFNNLLGVILGHSQFAAEAIDPSSPAQKEIKAIQEAAGHAASLTKQLLAFSRRQVLQLSVLDLNRLIENLNLMLRRLIREDIELITRFAPELGPVRADPGQIQQIILNLVVNARDAMPKGGKLTIETANAELDREYTRNHADVAPGQYVMLSVSDTGVGIDQETQALIFEPFFTTKHLGQGTGLGLSTVYGIVKQSGGDITVCSELGRGATFKIYLPRTDESTAETTQPDVGGQAPGGTETLLVVEDAPMLREVTRTFLERCGYRVLVAENAEDAMQIARSHPGPIPLLVTDVVMPGESGPALAKLLAAKRPEMKVLYVSGYTDNIIVNDRFLRPGSAFLAKPYTCDSLARNVRELLDSP